MRKSDRGGKGRHHSGWRIREFQVTAGLLERVDPLSTAVLISSPREGVPPRKDSEVNLRMVISTPFWSRGRKESRSFPMASRVAHAVHHLPHVVGSL